MKNPLKRTPKPYMAERLRLLETAKSLDPTTDDYKIVMNRIDQLDKILNRTTELKKTVIPVFGTIGGVVGIYALQQFAGVLVPKAMDALASRSPQKTREPE